MSKFDPIRVLIIDPAGNTRRLLKTLLIQLGVKKITDVKTTEEGTAVLRDVYDIVFCDEAAGQMHPYAFARALRRDTRLQNVTIPLVMVSNAPQQDMLVQARDAGISDVIAKPVSAETIDRKIHSLVLEPRDFVVTKSFIGPDRRSRGERRIWTREERDRRRQEASGEVFTVPPRVEGESSDSVRTAKTD